MSEQINTPKLRFPEVNYIWTITSLGNLGIFKKSYSLSRAYED